eukprot:CAMPEP_0184674566 /NCGR_PEP_ID=MMETSP0308-20130426/87310_1 /TAXON_ID=38269 /ORGANISM="Gloeochaete witrockiana, Strain SAG 46.84" /LENGTH=42 /DNA_ID= /DNA_START= /DNA_END= /DNA_ORIENTATION=
MEAAMIPRYEDPFEGQACGVGRREWIWHSIASKKGWPSSGAR